MRVQTSVGPWVNKGSVWKKAGEGEGERGVVNHGWGTG